MMRALLLLLLVATPASAGTLDALDWTQRIGTTLPMDVPLQDMDGTPATLRAVSSGRPLILVPGYFHCPNLCGVVRDDVFAAVSASGLQAGRDVAIALVTIDAAETPQQARAAVQGVLDRYPGLGLHALTGPPASLAAIADAAGFQARPDAREFVHPAGIVLASPEGAITGYLLGVGYDPAALAAAVARARDGVPRAAEPVHLFCFTYDPATGRYSVAVMEALRAAGIVTVAGIAAVLLRLGRRA